MFCIILPVTIAPVLFILFWADRKAAKVGTISIAASDMQAKQLAQGLDAKARLWSWLKYYFRRIDAFGLILLGFAFSLILLPFSLYAQAENQWKNRESENVSFIVKSLMTRLTCCCVRD